ncbi:hypothetical protein GCM10023189_11080 [Nibrella saemangeumensis]|uniref:Uncharacterized protein n=2 Tax=Nibrella saemangeumensis TaxID=1084526 RepID=A0ABP8MKC9_9BACT
MTPLDLYNRIPEREDNDLSVLVGCYYNHLPEATTFSEQNPILRAVKEKVLIRYYKDHFFDNHYRWRLASVWFDAKPVMIIQNAGLEGEEFKRRIITNAQLYLNLVQHLNGKLTDVFINTGELIEPTEEIWGLDDFYGSMLDTSFEPSPHALLSGVWPYELTKN